MTVDVRAGYDAIAEKYAEYLFNELAGKPLDRELLDRFAERMRNRGPVCDLGCGPGQVARYLRDRGVEIFGLDLSPGMVETARRLNPDIEFQEGDMTALDAADEAWAGIAAFHAVVNLPRDLLTGTFAELKRVLRPEGALLLSFHVGTETVHRDELWGISTSLDFLFFQPEEIRTALLEAGFEIDEMIERDPYPEVEFPSRRCYVVARKSP